MTEKNNGVSKVESKRIILKPYYLDTLLKTQKKGSKALENKRYAPNFGVIILNQRLIC